MPLLLMENTVQPYHWGSHEAIARIQGRPAPTDSPEAEVWMGTHPKAPSTVCAPGKENGSANLLELVRDDPQSYLGRRARLLQPPGEEQPALPFLFKILSAQKALSIQAHPDRLQAQEGFNRETNMGISVTAPNRNYRDRNHKPELICALTDFYGMAGFRPYDELAMEIKEVVTTVGSLLPGTVRSAMQKFCDEPTSETLQLWFSNVANLLLPERKNEAKKFVEAVVRYADSKRKALPSGGGRHTADMTTGEGTNEAENSTADRNNSADPKSDRYWWVKELAQQYPNDPGLASPLFLNLVHLKPSEAAYLGPRRLHAYLQGTGIELMANCDNVLRAGCTTKHVDPGELARVLLFEGERPRPIRPEDGPVTTYRTEAEEFELTRVGVAVGDLVDVELRDAPAILLSLGATLAIEGLDRPVRSGQSVFAGADTSHVKLRIVGTGGHNGMPSGNERADRWSVAGGIGEVAGGIGEAAGGTGEVAVLAKPQVFIASIPSAVTVTVGR